MAIPRFVSVQRGPLVAAGVAVASGVAAGALTDNWLGASSWGLLAFQIVLAIDGIRLWREAREASEEAMQTLDEVDELQRTPVLGGPRVVFLRRPVRRKPHIGPDRMH